MKLYAFPVAPNPTKVLVYLAEKGLELPVEWVNLPAGEQKRPEFLARNPLGKLPVLELDDGGVLTESLAIIEYLEELHPDPPLIGTTPLERARTRELERLCDLGVLLNAAHWVHATRSPLGWPANPQVAELALQQLEQSLDVLDERIGAGPFVAGERLCVADCTLWAGLQFGRFGKLEIAPRFGKVLAWRERFAQRPSTQGPVPAPPRPD